MLDSLLRISREIGPSLYERLEYNAPYIRGAMLGVDQFWLKAYIKDQFSNEATFQQSQLYSRVSIDFSYRPARWDEHCSALGYPENAGPIYCLVILREERDISTLDLPNYLENYPIFYEYWNPCIAVSNYKSLFEKIVELNDSVKAYISNTPNQTKASLSVGKAFPDTAGTLGGFLQCPQTRKIYLISCAHVLGMEAGTKVFNPGPYEGKKTKKIGNVRLSILPNLDGETCNPRKYSQYNPYSDYGLDVAVAELNADDYSLRTSHPSNSVEHVRMISSMSLHDKVLFHGKVSGKTEAKIRYLCLWDEILIDDEPYCFRDIFVLSSRQPQYLNTALCSPGDSGSWVISDFEDLLSWDGMLFAGDGSHAYCCFAEYILEACKTSDYFRYGLSLVT